MSVTTLTRGGAARTNQTSVRPTKRVQPDPNGGRPVDPLMEGFEGAFQGLVLCKDDKQLDRDWVEQFRFVLAREQTLVRQIFAGRSVKEVEREIRACHRITEKLVEQIDEREKRLGVVEIDQQSIVSKLDSEINERAYFASLARRFE